MTIELTMYICTNMYYIAIYIFLAIISICEQNYERKSYALIQLFDFKDVYLSLWVDTQL